MLKKFIFSRRPARVFQLFFISAGEMTGAPVGAKIQIFEIFKIMKMLKNDFNKITTWKSDQEEFYIMMFGISKWIHIIHRILFEFRISSLVQQFRADRRAGGAWSARRSARIVKQLQCSIHAISTNLFVKSTFTSNQFSKAIAGPNLKLWIRKVFYEWCGFT